MAPSNNVSGASQGSALKMEAVCSSQTLISTCKSTQCH
jgi:hypothetical protein